MNLINSPKTYEQGPARISELKREKRSLEAMGNQSGANVLQAQIDKFTRHWESLVAKHQQGPMEWADNSDLSKIDTQSR